MGLDEDGVFEMNQKISEMTLSERIRGFRIDRPSEWMMDEFMRDAKNLEDKLAEIAELDTCYFIPDEIDGEPCVTAVPTMTAGYVLYDSIKAIMDKQA